MKISSRTFSTAFQSLMKEGSKATNTAATRRAAPAFFQSLSSNSMTSKRSFGTSKILNAASGQDILASFGNTEFEGKNVALAMEALANADAVCFDVDSTVIQEEGIVSEIIKFRNNPRRTSHKSFSFTIFH